MSSAVMLNTFGNVSTQILCKARTWQAMARDPMSFDSFAKLHPQYRTPTNALIGQAVWATVLLTFAHRREELVRDDHRLLLRDLDDL